MRDNPNVQRLWRFLVSFLACWILPIAESAGQSDTSVTVIVKTPGKDAVKSSDEAIEVAIYNPTHRLMTVDVVYLPVEADDLVNEGDASLWKTVQVTVKGGERRSDSGIKTKNRTLFFVAHDADGWYTGSDDADTPTVRLQGRVVHTREVDLVGAKTKGFSLPTEPTITTEQIHSDRKRARIERLTAEQPVLSRLVGVIVERLEAAGHLTYRIVRVEPNSPAEKYDLNVGDVVFAVDRRKFRSDDELEALVARMERTQKRFNLSIMAGKEFFNYVFNPPGERTAHGDPVEPSHPTRRLAPQPALGVKVRTHRDTSGRASGAEIVSIVAGSAAAQKRLRIGDVITSLLGERVLNEQALAGLESKLKRGMRVDFQYVSVRSNRLFSDTIEFPVFVEVRTEKPSLSVLVGANPGGYVRVTQVDPGSPLEGVLKRGYIIIELNERQCRSVDDFEQALLSLKPGQQDVSLVYLNTSIRPAERNLKRFSMP